VPNSIWRKLENVSFASSHVDTILQSLLTTPEFVTRVIRDSCEGERALVIFVVWLYQKHAITRALLLVRARKTTVEFRPRRERETVGYAVRRVILQMFGRNLPG